MEEPFTEKSCKYLEKSALLYAITFLSVLLNTNIIIPSFSTLFILIIAKYIIEKGIEKNNN